ncbi:hypothetical protein [Demequina maris]|uniref:hypothetical protein n=1 Tax=Demequina maris TaxID=1638982 RepID=UPI00078562FF|nr:hypothetical protein [Demequina maris]
MNKSETPTRRFYAGVGEVSNEFALLEEELRDLVVRVVDAPLAHVLMSGINTRGLADHFRRVVGYHHELPDSAIERMDAIYKAIQRISDMRNFVVHASWVKLTEPGEHLGTQSRYAGTRDGADWYAKQSVWTPTDLADLAAFIVQVREAVAAFALDYFPGAPPETPWRREAWKRFSDAWQGIFDDAEALVAGERPS